MNELIRRQHLVLISQSQPSIVSGNGVQLWSERGDLLLQLGDQGGPVLLGHVKSGDNNSK